MVRAVSFLEFLLYQVGDGVVGGGARQVILLLVHLDLSYVGFGSGVGLRFHVHMTVVLGVELVFRFHAGESGLQLENCNFFIVSSWSRFILLQVILV